MGYNTALIIRNDSLNEISEDKEFGAKVAAAILGKGLRSQDIRSGSCVNAASVLSVEHADTTVVIAVGGNHGTVLAQLYNQGRHVEEEDRRQLVRQLAEELGYELRKKIP